MCERERDCVCERESMGHTHTTCSHLQEKYTIKNFQVTLKRGKSSTYSRQNCFVLFTKETGSQSSLVEGMNLILQNNRDWNPSYCICSPLSNPVKNRSEPVPNRIQNVFPGTKIVISDCAREQAWDEALVASGKLMLPYASFG